MSAVISLTRSNISGRFSWLKPLLLQNPYMFRNGFSWSVFYKNKRRFHTKLIKTHNLAIKPQYFDYFLVLDFEATCDSRGIPQPQEIILFPVYKVSGKTFEQEASFGSFVQPNVHKSLSHFCVQLTGITSEDVENEPYLDEVLKKFDNWLRSEGLFEPDVKFTFVTSGDWDLSFMLPNQCKDLGIEMPDYFQSWINIKKSYAIVTGVWPKQLPSMTAGLGLPYIGRLHNGFDDCRNVAAILKALALRGLVFQETTTNHNRNG